MGKLVGKPQPCLNPDCGSSDARRIYDNGSSFCFSCRKSFPAGYGGEEPSQVIAPSPSKFFKKETIDDVKEYPVRGIREREVSKAIAEFYKMRVTYGDDGNINAHYYPYENETAYKRRELPKKFSWIGTSEDLFGRELFTGGGKRVIICEGEIDTMATAQAVYDRWERHYPVVGLSSAVMAEKSLMKNRDWLRSFQEIVMATDMDEPGREAAMLAVKILGQDKVKIVKFSKKDAGEVFLEKGSSGLLEELHNAEKYIPVGIATKEQLWNAVVEYRNTPSIAYPEFLEGVQLKTKGIREGEISLFISGTSCGKSTMMREIMLHLKETTPDEKKIGIVSLEESIAETTVKLSAMDLRRNPANEEIPLEELNVGFKNVFDSDRFVVLDHQGSMKDETIMDKIEYMAILGCKFIFIDHITILVSEGADGLTGNEAIDKTMNDLLRFVKRHGVWVGLVSHLRKTPVGGKAFEQGVMPSLDDIKGSGSIKQISFDIIAFARDLTAENEIKRNSISMSVLKCRFSGLTGGVAGAYYDFVSGRMKPPVEIPMDGQSEEKDFVNL